jgi:hypothetical protein
MQPMPGNQQPEPMQQEMLPPTFLLGTTDTDIGYVAQLPQRIDDAWGMEVVHPWFRGQLKKLLGNLKKYKPAVEVEVAASVHSQTLGKWVRDQEKLGKAVDEDALGVQRIAMAELVAPAKGKGEV